MTDSSGGDTSEPFVIADTLLHTGEGPLYHPDGEVVYWLDIPPGDLFRYDPARDEYSKVLDYDGVIGGFTVQENGDLLLFCDRGTIVPWNEESGLGEPVVEEIPSETQSRFNDVIAGPKGRVYCGTMPTEDRGGRLYSLSTDRTLTVLEEDVSIPNGLGFSPDCRYLYFTETMADRIYRYRFDETTGSLGDRTTFVSTEDVRGHPDGMTVDADGHVWAAFWNGGRITRYDPDGTEIERISFPAKKVSAVTFGGGDYRAAYVTTALGPGDGEPGTRAEEGLGAGALFQVDVGVRGKPEFRSQIQY